MKTILIKFSLLLAVFMFWGCSDENEPQTNLGKELILNIGNTVKITDDIEVGFIKVPIEGRYPLSICYLSWGYHYAEVEVSFSKNDEKCNMLFRIEGCTTNDNTMCYKDTLGYRINVYRLDPYPGETETFLIDSADYKIKLKVQKL